MLSFFKVGFLARHFKLFLVGNFFLGVLHLFGEAGLDFFFFADSFLVQRFNLVLPDLLNYL